METFADIIALWETAEALASDLKIPGNNPGGTVRAWKRRGNIPAEYWLPLVQAAQRRGIQVVTLEALARIASRSSTKEAA